MALCASLGSVFAPAARSQQLERVVITGSSVPRTDAETALPVQIIRREEIERSGAFSIEELLARISANFGGFNEAMGLNNADQPGFSGASLRGFGARATLVLLNGRRVANYAFSGEGGIGVDLHAIPMAAIDRIEVLKDGASAIYGSDAIAGVINFITRHDFRGAEVGLMRAHAQAGGGAQERETLTFGGGDTAADGFNVFAVIDHRRQRALAARQRAFAATSYRPELGLDGTLPTSFPANIFVSRGVFLNPAAPACTEFTVFQLGGCFYDYVRQSDILPPSDNLSLLVRGALALPDRNEAYAELLWSRQQTRFASSATPVSRFGIPGGQGLVIPESSPFYPTGLGLSGDIVNPRYRTVPLGPRVTDIATDQWRALAGWRGAVAGWDVDTALARSSGHSTSGVLYVADTGNHLIRKVALDGTVSTLAGSPGANGFADGTGAAARFDAPMGITLGPEGDLYVADSNNHKIRRVTTAGAVSTYAGSTSGFTDGPPTSARFTVPQGLVAAPSGDLYVADTGNLRVRLISRSGSSAGMVSRLAGSGLNVEMQPDGPGNVASIPFPSTLTLRGNTLIVADEAGLLRQIDITTSVVSTLTGSRALGLGYADGPAGKSRLRIVRGITPVAGGGYLVADDNSLRSVSTAGVVTTISTTAIGVAATATGVGVLAQQPIIMGPNTRQALTVDPAGNVVIADFATTIVRRIAPSGAVTLAAGLSGNFGGPVDGTANEAQFVWLGPIASDPAGVLYVTDHYAVRRIGTDNVVTFVAGSYTDVGNNDGNATTARFFDMNGIAVGPGGNVFVADHNAIRKVDPAGNVTTYAGVTGQFGIVDGPAASARFQFPTTLAFAADGTLYVQDGSLIRRISADGATVSQLAVNDVEGGLAVDAAGTVYYGSAFGLAMISTGGTRTLLIPKGPATVLGLNPTLLNVFGIAVLGPKRLVIQTGFDRLIATLP